MLRGRSFLKDDDLTAEEFRFLLTLAGELKAERREGRERPRLAGRAIALIFEKTSTRTRCAFEAAAYDQGAHVTYLDPAGSQIGHKESIKDTARVLGRMYDGIQYRGRSQRTVEELAEHAGVPVWNGLTDEWHPTQSLCDVFTMAEHCPRPLADISYAYVGDARNNVAASLLAAGALLGMDVRIVAPPELLPAGDAGGRVTLTSDVEKGVRGADFVHTDVWVSMGEPEELWAERIELLRPYRITRDVLAATENPGVRFMHCLPAVHNRETELGERLYRRFGLDGLEVTEDVFESPASIVFDQAENRLHTTKAVLVATLAG